MIAVVAYIAVAPVCVDMLELNTVVDAKGDTRFTQVIAWEWNELECRYDVQAWWMVDDAHLAKPYCTRNGVTCRRGELVVNSRNYRITKTRHDPEERNRILLPTYLRRGL